jgi:hypothetical protein
VTLVLMFVAGLLFGNGIPHFVHGVSGEDFHTPQVHRLAPGLPSPIVNVLWGLANFAVAIGLAVLANPPAPSIVAEWLTAAAGFAFASIGLSIYFPRRTAAEARRQRKP